MSEIKQQLKDVKIIQILIKDDLVFGLGDDSRVYRWIGFSGSKAWWKGHGFTADYEDDTEVSGNQVNVVMPGDDQPNNMAIDDFIEHTAR